MGPCEYVQHASIFDCVAVSGSLEGRSVEYVDHLHEHFEDPCVVRGGSYVVPMRPGAGVTMKAASLEAHSFPTGAVWRPRAQP